MVDNDYTMDMGSHGKAEVKTLRAALDELASKTTADRDEMVIYDISGHAVDEDDDLADLEDDGSTGRVALIWASHDAADNDDGSHAIGEIRREMGGEAEIAPMTAHEYALARGWDHTQIEETARRGVADEDVAALEGTDLTRDELLRWCRAEAHIVSEVPFIAQLKPDGGTYRIRVSTDDARAIGVGAGDYVHIIMRRAK